MVVPRGFTLIELLVTITVVALLVLATAPLASNWVSRTQTHSGSTVLQEAFSVAKALALQNPNGVASPGAAAGLRITTDGTTTTLLVCTGSASSANCATSASPSTVQWSSTYSGMVTTTVTSAVNSSTGTTTTSSQAAAVGSPVTIDLDNRGEALPVNTAYSYTISRGAAGNTEGYALY